VRFFQGLTNIVNMVVTENVTDFVKQAESARVSLMGGVSLLELQRQELYTTMLMCQAYFSLFSTIAKMYKQVSRDHVMPGLTLCDELSKITSQPHAFGVKRRQLETFANDSQTYVRELIREVCFCP
jgi:hypothetical protein